MNIAEEIIQKNRKATGRDRAVARRPQAGRAGCSRNTRRHSRLSKKKQLVEEICTELSVHAQVEEEIFYPAVKEALDDHELVPEATVEHASLKALISEVEGVEPDGEMFDARRSRCCASTSSITSRKSTPRCSRRRKQPTWT